MGIYISVVFVLLLSMHSLLTFPDYDGAQTFRSSVIAAIATMMQVFAMKLFDCRELTNFLSSSFHSRFASWGS